MNANECLVNDVKARFWQQAMDISHAAIGRVLDRDHTQISRTRPNGLHRVFECVTGKRVEIGACFDASLMTIGTKFSLKRDFLGHFCPLHCSFVYFGQ